MRAGQYRTPHRSWAVLSAFAGGLGLLFCWQPTTTPSASSPANESPSAVASAPLLPPGDSALSEASASAVAAPTPAPASPPPGPQNPQPDTALASFGTYSAPHPARSASLPLGSQEISPDGLPASAIHCQWDGERLICGTCQTDADCPPGSGCLLNRETRRMECLDSECEEDSHCFPGFVCRTVAFGMSSEHIRRCQPEGVRREGESCDTGYVSSRGACREGLRCIEQVCTRPCQLEEPTSCPAGHACTDGRDGPGCVPDCQQLGCPEGQQCKRLPRGRARCLAQVSGTCPETPCAEGERCNTLVSRERGAFWCAPRCTPLLPDSCPPGQVCGWAGGTDSACYRTCTHTDLDSCGEGWHCTTVAEDLTLWGCRPDLRAL